MEGWNSIHEGSSGEKLLWSCFATGLNKPIMRGTSKYDNDPVKVEHHDIINEGL